MGWCQVFVHDMLRHSMYTIKQAAQRTGIPVPLLRAWERRYGVVVPTRTEAGYRLYDDDAIQRLRAMRGLVGSGWSARQAAEHLVTLSADDLARLAAGPDERPAADEGRPESLAQAAARVDAIGIERALDDIFASGSFEVAVERRLYPALKGLGDAWERGEVDVAGEHAASSAVLRRLGMAFEAAGHGNTAVAPVLVGLPPGGRHELPALAFATALLRAGIEATYLGADVPTASWVAAATEVNARAVVMGVSTADDVAAATGVAEMLLSRLPELIVAVGGRHAADLPKDMAVPLPDAPGTAVAEMRRLLSSR